MTMEKKKGYGLIAEGSSGQDQWDLMIDRMRRDREEIRMTLSALACIFYVQWYHSLIKRRKLEAGGKFNLEYVDLETAVRNPSKDAEQANGCMALELR